MAVNNRTEADNAVDAAIIATVTNSIHKTLLKDEINSSVVFRKDVILSETPGGGTVTIDYIDKDTATVVITDNLVVSFTNIENGDVKYLSISKQVGNTVSFSGTTDASARKAFIDTAVTLVVYEVKNKNGNIYINSINIDNDVAGNLLTKKIDINVWNMISTSSVTIATGIDADKIIGVRFVTIFPDDAVFKKRPLDGSVDTDFVDGYFSILGDGSLELIRFSTGVFNDALYDRIDINRGSFVIDYLP